MTEPSARTRERRLIKKLYDALLESTPDPKDYDFGPAYEHAVQRRREALRAFRAWNNRTEKKAVP